MSYEYASDAIDVVSVAMLVGAIGIVWSRSIGLGLILLSAQSLLLAIGGLHAGIATEEWHVVLGAVLTVIAKGVVAPLLIWLMVSRLPVPHDVHAWVGQGWSTIAAVVTALVLSRSLTAGPFETAIGAERVLPAAITIILLGVQIMITHRQALMQVVGFLVLENGMALAALTAFYGMPLVIELGIFLDLLLAVFVAFVYTQRMHLAFGSLDTLHFTRLRG